MIDCSTPKTPTSAPDPLCQFATSYNAFAFDLTSTSNTDDYADVMLSVSNLYPPPQPLNGLKPTFADTACNRHMYGDVLLIEDLHAIPAVWIRVANEAESSRLCATQMGTVHLDGIGTGRQSHPDQNTQCPVFPALPANLISISALYNSGYRVVDPHYGRKQSDMNMYFANDSHIIPAYKDESGDGFCRFFHYTESRACSTTSNPDVEAIQSAQGLFDGKRGILRQGVTVEDYSE